LTAIDLEASFSGESEITPWPDPTEDFTTFTEVDPETCITVSADTVDVNDIDQDHDAYVYADKGIGHFGITFEHDVAAKPIGLGRDDRGHFWNVSNTVDDAKALWDDNREALQAFFRCWNASGVDKAIYIFECSAHDSDATSSPFWSVGTTYYFTIERTEDTKIELRIYSDSNRTTLLDTLRQDVPTGDSYRYVFGFNNWNEGSQYRNPTLDIYNLDLHEDAVSGSPWYAYAQQ